MSLIEDLVFFLFSSPTTLLGAVALLLVLYLVSGSFAHEMGKEPPGPRPLPLLGNLLQLDLKRPYRTLCEMSLALLSPKKNPNVTCCNLFECLPFAIIMFLHYC